MKRSILGLLALATVLIAALVGTQLAAGRWYRDTAISFQQSPRFEFSSHLSAASSEASGTSALTVPAQLVLAGASPMQPTPIAPADPTRSKIALTFDDGPAPGFTEHILAILAGRDVRATFFLQGRLVERAPDLAGAVAAAGHAIGNHTYNHPALDTLSQEAMDRQIVRTNEIIKSATGVRPSWVRPPYGRTSKEVYEAITRAGMRAAMWTIDPRDWTAESTPDSVVSAVMGAAQPGGVVVLHDRGPATIAALPGIIDSLRAAGYQFVTLDEL